MVKNIFGGSIIESALELDELVDDEIEQILNSETLFTAFDNASKFKKFYSRRKSRKLFEHVLCLYNDSIENVHYRCINVSTKDYTKSRIHRTRKHYGIVFV